MVKKIMVGSEGDLVLKDKRGSFASVELTVISATIKLASGIKEKTKQNWAERSDKKYSTHSESFFKHTWLVFSSTYKQILLLLHIFPG